MRARLEDVAERAGVSVSTVSRVVNGKRGVAETTRRRVLEHLDVLGYDRPRGSRAKRTGLVGLIVPELVNPVFPAFVQAIEQALAATGQTPLLCTATPVVQEHEYIDMLLERGISGLVLVSGRHANRDIDHRRYAELRGMQLPMVFVNGAVPGLDVPTVSADDTAGVGSAVAYLEGLGHRRIGCALGPARYITSQRQAEGFRAVRSGESDDPGDLLVHSSYTVEGGQTAAGTLLDAGATAILCGSDLMALGAIRAAVSRGLRVPEDLSVIGHDDSLLMSFMDPPLTTLRMDVAGMSRHAVDALIDQMEGRGASGAEVLFRMELVVRGSTAAPVTRPHARR